MSSADVVQFGTQVWEPFSAARRLVVWFSCGAASAVAAKLAIEVNAGRLPVEVVYCDTGSEHPDNRRFMFECESWFQHDIRVLRSEEYADIWSVFDKTNWLVGPKGARCTTELKKSLREKFERVDDLQVFGFDTTERRRRNQFIFNQPEVMLWAPLIDEGISKQECFRRIEDAGIELPAMYRLGYRNNNCIGCVKGQAGYWNKIRVDFPEVFQRMADQERRLGVAINKRYEGSRRIKVFLDELDPNAGRYSSEPSLSCGVVCTSEDAP